jgi:general secretion pathway protein D
MSDLKQFGRFGLRNAMFCALVAVMLGGCSGIDKYLEKDQTGVTDETVPNAVLQADLSARFPQAQRGRPGDPPTPPSQVFPGATGDDRTPGAPIEQGAVQRGGDEYDLNFQNAEISAVSKVLLGDLLKVSYTIDPRVQGTVSLSSGRAVAKKDLVPLLESVLKLVNAQVVREGAVYKIVPAGEALGGGVVDRDPSGKLTPGYGISVMPLQYVSAQAVLRAIDSFAARPGMARVEPGRNLLLVQGTSIERASAIEAALALDVDWMRNQAVGIFPIRNASPETIISELRNVFDSGREGAAANLVRFQPVNRLNAVLAVAQTNALINQVRTWISRLDRSDDNNTTVRIYRLRYGNAKVVAGILREVFTGQGSGASNLPGTSDMSQLTPGSSARTGTSAGTAGTAATSASPTTSTIFGGGAPGGAARAGGIGSGTTASQSDIGGQNDISALSNTGIGGAGTGILPNVRIIADIANNSLVIYGSRDQYKVVERAIFEIDRAPLQVAIDVTVAEITLKNQLQFGVQFYLQDIKNGSQQGSIGFGLNNVIARTIPGANLVLGSDTDPRVILNALRAITDVKVVSSPALVVLDNQLAILQVGDQVPVATRQAQDVTTPNAPLVSSIEMKDTGVILRVTPRINANGVVNLDVIQEVSAVQPQTDPTLTPTISQRRIQSTIAVASGQTVLLGGMISSKDTRGKQAIPGLGDIKGIGDLFSSKDGTKERTELIMFIRPQIIRDSVDAQLVAEELRSKLSVIARGSRAPAGAAAHSQ